MKESRWIQRRVSTSNKTLRLPRALLSFALVDLTWEIVKANLSSHVRGDWPWRLTVLDASTCAAVVALLTGIIVTRSQLSQTMQPVLSWSGFAGRSHELTDSISHYAHGSSTISALTPIQTGIPRPLPLTRSQRSPSTPARS